MRILIFLILISISVNAADIVATLDSDDGSSAFVIKDSSAATVGSLDSDGKFILAGSLEVQSGSIKVSQSGQGIGNTLGESAPRSIEWDGTGTLIRDTGYIDFIMDSNNDNPSISMRFYTDGDDRAGATLLAQLYDSGTFEAKCFDGFGISPIGAIIAWHKSFANTPALPDGWVECNGQVLADADSPYNGQTIPDLNSQVYAGSRGHYLRGGATSGSFNGSTYWTDNGVKYNGVGGGSYYGACYAALGRTEQSTGTLMTYSTTPLPDRTFQVAAMTVVWIMRVK